MEERHFIEIVTLFRDRQKKSGKNLARELRAELRRFGYLAEKGGLRIIVEIMDDPDELPIDDDALVEYHEVIKRIAGRTFTPNSPAA